MKKMICFILLIGLSQPLLAAGFALHSPDIADNQMMSAEQEYNGFGCTGKNISPRLNWTNAPANTKSFAVTLFDPDAPTGSGWWHWQIVNIPAGVNGLKKDAGNPAKNIAPAGSLQIQNDFGARGFGGPCPPPGSRAHHYEFTVYALSVDHLNVKADSSNALVGYMIKANALASAKITALYRR